jgi:hypothetical protein
MMEKLVDIADAEGLLKDIGKDMSQPVEILVNAATLRLVIANSWMMLKELKTLREDYKLLLEKVK